MVFDVEQHRKNQIKFLTALHEIGRSEYEAKIGEKAGLNRDDASRIGTEMLDANHVSMATGNPINGPLLTLEPSGRDLVEKYLYDKSPLGKRRKAWAWLKYSAQKFILQCFGIK
jgi:hypothetical protein